MFSRTYGLVSLNTKLFALIGLALIAAVTLSALVPRVAPPLVRATGR
jgi:hypothetical protein